MIFRFNQTSPDRTGQDITLCYRTGWDRTGQDRMGQDGTGQDVTGHDRMGRDGTFLYVKSVQRWKKYYWNSPVALGLNP
eukprot:1377551-Ditylum_brightwellii.AAC.1